MITENKFKRYKSITRNIKIYNSWRAVKFTKKGKKIGYCQSWDKYDNFYNDMFSSYVDGYVLNRLDKEVIFSKENCVWSDRSELTRRSKCNLEYMGETKNLLDWCLIYQLNYNGVRQRYHKGKNYTTEQILFGKNTGKQNKVSCSKEVKGKILRIKASKMVSQYKLKDKKRGYTSGFDFEWFIDNILDKSCVYCGSDKKIGADRIDNNIGHTKENIVPCCYRCNVVRGNSFTHEEMVKLGQFIKHNIDKPINA